MAEPKTPAGDTDAAKAGESNRDAFVRLAQKRVTNVVTALSRLEQLARPANYEYGAADVQKIETAVDEAVQNTMRSLTDGKIAPQTVFTL